MIRARLQSWRDALVAIAIALAALAGTARDAAADDWATYRHDNRRSGATAEKPRLPLKETWRYDSPARPVPAWTGPAKWNAYAGMKGLKSMRDFDSVFYVTVNRGAVFFGSSADDAAHCLDAATGKKKWVFHTDGPVRLPPTAVDGKVYIASDDGRAYCVKASDGSLVWKYQAAPDRRLIASNGKLISPWPCRTGVLVAGGKAYFAASLFPWRQSQFCSVSAETGSDSGEGLYSVVQKGLAVQGAMLASDTRVFAPQGRSAALVFNRKDGKFIGTLGARGDGGVHAILTKDSHLIYGPGSRTGWLSVQDGNSRKRILAFTGAVRIAIGPETAYLYKPGSLSAFRFAEHIKLTKQMLVLRTRHRALGGKLKKLRVETERKKVKRELDAISVELKRLQQAGNACFGWKVNCPAVHELIVAGDTIFVGVDGGVRGLSARDGKELWKAAVDGKAGGLAFAGGRLFVSTDTGKIYCFSSAGG